ncbi:MAG: hypothetical protein ABIO17_12345, partial [Pseudoxanthomonas sp.]
MKLQYFDQDGHKRPRKARTSKDQQWIEVLPEAFPMNRAARNECGRHQSGVAVSARRMASEWGR